MFGIGVAVLLFVLGLGFDASDGALALVCAVAVPVRFFLLVPMLRRRYDAEIRRLEQEFVDRDGAVPAESALLDLADMAGFAAGSYAQQAGAELFGRLARKAHASLSGLDPEQLARLHALREARRHRSFEPLYAIGFCFFVNGAAFVCTVLRGSWGP